MDPVAAHPDNEAPRNFLAARRFTSRSTRGVTVGTASSLQFGVSRSFSVVLWALPSFASEASRPLLDLPLLSCGAPGTFLLSIRRRVPRVCFGGVEIAATDPVLEAADGEDSSAAWVCVCFVCDREAGRMLLYVNGAEAASADASQCVLPRSAAIVLGAAEVVRDEPVVFEGQIAGVQMIAAAVDPAWVAEAAGVPPAAAPRSKAPATRPRPPQQAASMCINPYSNPHLHSTIRSKAIRLPVRRTEPAAPIHGRVDIWPYFYNPRSRRIESSVAGPAPPSSKRQTLGMFRPVRAVEDMVAQARRKKKAAQALEPQPPPPQPVSAPPRPQPPAKQPETADGEPVPLRAGGVASEQDEPDSAPRDAAVAAVVASLALSMAALRSPAVTPLAATNYFGMFLCSAAGGIPDDVELQGTAVRARSGLTTASLSTVAAVHAQLARRKRAELAGHVSRIGLVLRSDSGEGIDYDLHDAGDAPPPEAATDPPAEQREEPQDGGGSEPPAESEQEQEAEEGGPASSSPLTPDGGSHPCKWFVAADPEGTTAWVVVEAVGPVLDHLFADGAAAAETFEPPEELRSTASPFDAHAGCGRLAQQVAAAVAGQLAALGAEAAADGRRMGVHLAGFGVGGGVATVLGAALMGSDIEGVLLHGVHAYGAPCVLSDPEPLKGVAHFFVNGDDVVPRLLAAAADPARARLVARVGCDPGGAAVGHFHPAGAVHQCNAANGTVRKLPAARSASLLSATLTPSGARAHAPAAYLSAMYKTLMGRLPMADLLRLSSCIKSAAPGPLPVTLRRAFAAPRIWTMPASVRSLLCPDGSLTPSAATAFREIFRVIAPRSEVQEGGADEAGEAKKGQQQGGDEKPAGEEASEQAEGGEEPAADGSAAQDASHSPPDVPRMKPQKLRADDFQLAHLVAYGCPAPAYLVEEWLGEGGELDERGWMALWRTRLCVEETPWAERLLRCAGWRLCPKLRRLERDAGTSAGSCPTFVLPRPDVARALTVDAPAVPLLDGGKLSAPMQDFSRRLYAAYLEADPSRPKRLPPAEVRRLITHLQLTGPATKKRAWAAPLRSSDTAVDGDGRLTEEGFALVLRRVVASVGERVVWTGFRRCGVGPDLSLPPQGWSPPGGMRPSGQAALAPSSIAVPKPSVLELQDVKEAKREKRKQRRAQRRLAAKLFELYRDDAVVEVTGGPAGGRRHQRVTAARRRELEKEQRLRLQRQATVQWRRQVRWEKQQQKIADRVLLQRQAGLPHDFSLALSLSARTLGRRMDGGGGRETAAGVSAAGEQRYPRRRRSL